MQLHALRDPRSTEHHQVNTTCLIISELWLLSLQELVHRVNFNDSCFPLSFLRIFHMRERKSRGIGKKSYALWCEFGACWLRGTALPGNRFSMFCTCYFVALMTCFLIGLMSLSLVLRAASYYRLVPFHNIVQPIFITAWVGHLGLDS